MRKNYKWLVLVLIIAVVAALSIVSYRYSVDVTYTSPRRMNATSLPSAERAI